MLKSWAYTYQMLGKDGNVKYGGFITPYMKGSIISSGTLNKVCDLIIEELEHPNFAITSCTKESCSPCRLLLLSNSGAL